MEKHQGDENYERVTEMPGNLALINHSLIEISAAMHMVSNLDCTMADSSNLQLLNSKIGLVKIGYLIFMLNFNVDFNNCI